MSGPEMTEQQIKPLVKQIDRRNLEARNCTLDSVQLLVSKLVSESTPEIDEIVEKSLGDIKHHFAHNRDGIVTVVESVMRGGTIREFQDGG